MLLASPLGGSTQVSNLIGFAIAAFGCAWIIRTILQAGGLRGRNIEPRWRAFSPRWRVFSIGLLLVLLTGWAAFAVLAARAWIESL
jgi:hypothetical protein